MELHMVWTFRFPYLTSRYMLWTANFVITIFTLAPLRVLNSNIGLRIHTQILTCVAKDDQLTKEQGPFPVGLISRNLIIDILTACVLPTYSSSELLNDPLIRMCLQYFCFYIIADGILSHRIWTQKQLCCITRAMWYQTYLLAKVLVTTDVLTRFVIGMQPQVH